MRLNHSLSRKKMGIECKIFFIIGRMGETIALQAHTCSCSHIYSHNQARGHRAGFGHSGMATIEGKNNELPKSRVHSMPQLKLFFASIPKKLETSTRTGCSRDVLETGREIAEYVMGVVPVKRN